MPENLYPEGDRATLDGGDKCDRLECSGGCVGKDRGRRGQSLHKAVGPCNPRRSGEQREEQQIPQLAQEQREGKGSGPAEIYKHLSKDGYSGGATAGERGNTARCLLIFPMWNQGQNSG